MKDAAKYFFESRADVVTDVSLESLSYVSGRDPRLWSDSKLYDDMMNSIREQLDMSGKETLLEVGCAAGFLAKGLAHMSLEYTGVDIAPSPIKKAKMLGIENAVFKQADASCLPDPDNSFDRAISYDVFTNFPDFEFSRKIISEMLRVTRPGGKIMIGSIPDKAGESKAQEVAGMTSERLNREFGPLKNPEEKEGLLAKIKKWYIKNILKIEPRIVCYSFNKEDFEKFGKEKGVKTEILDIHKLNPYHGLRFNVVYTKDR